MLGKMAIRKIGCIVGVVLLAAIASTALLLYLGLPAMGESMFRGDFAVGSDMFTCRSDLERAVYFGGRSGLSRLRRLSQDPKIAPAGKLCATRLVTYIESGQHIVHLRRELSEVDQQGVPLPLLTKTLYRFVVWRDED